MPLPPSLKRKRLFQHTAARRRLGPTVQQGVNTVEFQHTAARRRLAADSNCRCASDFVSTHSRPKAAGGYSLLSGLGSSVSTHSRPKAAGRNQPAGRWVCMVSTHSRPKAAGSAPPRYRLPRLVSTHSRPKAAGQPMAFFIPFSAFQHTAARRRLVGGGSGNSAVDTVSTHSRPKAAGSESD